MPCFLAYGAISLHIFWLMFLASGDFCPNAIAGFHIKMMLYDDFGYDKFCQVV